MPTRRGTSAPSLALARWPGLWKEERRLGPGTAGLLRPQPSSAAEGCKPSRRALACTLPAPSSLPQPGSWTPPRETGKGTGRGTGKGQNKSAGSQSRLRSQERQRCRLRTRTCCTEKPVDGRRPGKDTSRSRREGGRAPEMRSGNLDQQLVPAWWTWPFAGAPKDGEDRGCGRKDTKAKHSYGGRGGGVRVVVTRTEGHLSENQLGTVKTIELGVDLYEKAGAAKKGKSWLKSGEREELEAKESKLLPELKEKGNQ